MSRICDVDVLRVCVYLLFLFIRGRVGWGLGGRWVMRDRGGRVITFSEVCIGCWLTLVSGFDAWVCIVCINSIYF